MSPRDTKSADLLPGTLDMLILKAVSLRPLHGYGVLLRINQISGDALDIRQGSLYPAVARHFPSGRKPLTSASSLDTLQAMRSGFRTDYAVRSGQATRADLLLETLA